MNEERITYEEFMIMFKNAPRIAYTLYDKAEDEIERLNNIINEFEEELEREINIKEEDAGVEHNTYIDVRNTLKAVLKNFKELKGSE